MRRLGLLAGAGLLATLGPLPVHATATGGVEPDEEWDVEEPADHGVDARTMGWSRVYAFQPGRNTQGVVVVRDGVIVAEWYAGGADQDSWAASWSMAKSFTSALIGIAIDDGLVASVDVPMVTYYPEFAGTEREGITLRDVLQMASGLDWNEDYDPAAIQESDIIQQVLYNTDQLAYAADRPAATTPGTSFNYSSGDTMLLSGVIEQATGMSVAEYGEQELFGPLGIDQVDWWQDAEGHTLTYCCLDTTSRDFARFGQLYLNGGAWGDEQVVSAEWVVESVTPSPSFEGYGYQWWLEGATDDRLPADTFAAEGHDGQFIYVIPSLDLVVVRNGRYVKHDGPPIADPSLFGYYPSDGLGVNRGTFPPENGWDHAAFLLPIVESISS